MSAAAAESLFARLRDQSAEIDRYQRHLVAQRKRRDLLIRKLLHLRITEREIAKRAGVSFARVHQIKAAALRVPAAEEPSK